ncbi:DNA-directed RNA polymerase II subunit RPB1-like [Venturia canescens]|uniref:DNA-directed RNA polymerase II subunit RPB1-like n=1 Tax=Venturia canescens TaxID=32260 RepID=UPI001C9BE0B8|nr:DNA-directed RNA polymerase II subunit RPB1-like [Venturia canescens]
MELLILLLLTPSLIPAHRYRSNSQGVSSTNDEPFLPIYPVYPYSPKLIKRGTERDLVAPLTAELYAPKLDARDSYTASFSGNYQRDPYYPSYNPYPKASGSSNYPVSSSLASAGFTPTSTYPASTSFASPGVFTAPNAGYASPNAAAYSGSSYTPYTAGYSSPYPYSPGPYGMYSSYSPAYSSPPSPYTTGPYGAGSYPNYNYQGPYFYPNYYNQPYPALPPPPPPHPGHEYSESGGSEDSGEVESTGKSNAGSKKSEGKKSRSKEDSESSDPREGQFVDGANFLSSGSKDLDGQPTTYKSPSPYNQLAQLSDVHLRSVPIPRTTYRVISVGGQPVGPDYPLPQSYAKVQQLEQIMSQTLAKLLAQNNGNQPGQSQFQYQTHEQSDNSGSITGQNLANKSPQSVIAKTGLAYVIDPTSLQKNNGQGQFVSNYDARNPVIIKVQDPNIQPSSTVLSKAAAKYADGRFPQKSIATVSLQQTPGVYIPPEAKDIKDENPQATEYNDYDSNAGQTYDASNSPYKKTEQNYSVDQPGQPAPYHNSNLVTVQTPQPQNYQYSSYLSTQSSQQQQPRDYKTSLDDVNFSTKRNTKV